MSTKIWEAHRIPLKRLNEYLDEARKLSMQKFFKCADWQINLIDWKQAAKRAKENPYIKKVNGRVIRWYAVDELIRNYYEDHKKTERGLFDVECGLSIWIDGKYAYIIPWGTTIRLPHFEWASDYHYQNQTDRPKGISAREYKERERTWDRIALDNWNAHRLVYNIVDFSPGAYEMSFQLRLHFNLLPAVPGNNSEWKPFRNNKS